MTTPWTPYKEYGCYYRLINNVLFYAPMLKGGDIERESAAEVETDEIDTTAIIKDLKYQYE